MCQVTPSQTCSCNAYMWLGLQKSTIEHKNCWFCSSLLYPNYWYNCNKTFITTAEFNGLSSAAYRNGILHSERKILSQIQLDVICAHMVDFHMPSHIILSSLCLPALLLAYVCVSQTMIAAILCVHALYYKYPFYRVWLFNGILQQLKTLTSTYIHCGRHTWLLNIAFAETSVRVS